MIRAVFLFVFVLSLLSLKEGKSQTVTSFSIEEEVEFSIDSGSLTSQPITLLKLKQSAPEWAQLPQFNRSSALQKELSQEPHTPFKNKLGNLFMGEVMMALVSTPAFANKGAYWTAGATHVMSLGAFNGGDWARNDNTKVIAFSLLNAVALHHYFIKPNSGSQVFWRNLAGLNVAALATHLADKSITKKKAQKKIS